MFAAMRRASRDLVTTAAAAAAASGGPAGFASSRALAFWGSKLCSGAFLVVDIEGRQTDVDDLFLTESDFVSRCAVLLQCIRWRINARRGCAARQRQQPSGPQHRYGFLPTRLEGCLSDMTGTCHRASLSVFTRH
jgi:hypothetical protein